MAPRGTLVVFEGLDKAGKSTQCAKLVQNLQAQGHAVSGLRFPDRTTVIGRMINDYLTGGSDQEDHVIHLLFCANRWEAVAKIEADLAAGTSVVIDRYYYSGVVYSAAKNNPSLSLEWARQPDEGLPRPDVCIFLNISAADAAQRGGFGEEKYEKKEMQDRVRELFGVLRQSAEKDDFVVVDGGQALDVVEGQVLEVALAAMRKVEQIQSPPRRVAPWTAKSQ